MAASCRLLFLAVALATAAAAQPPPGVGFGVPPPGTMSDRIVLVYGIAQDHEGYLWIASEDGLHRYDGVAFEPFRADPDQSGALPGNRVLGVAIDEDGGVWASVDQFGLVHIPPGRRTIERVSLPADPGRSRLLIGWGEGALWLKVSRSDASSSDSDTFERFDVRRRQLLRVRGARSVHVSGGVVLAESSAGVGRFREGGGWSRLTETARTAWIGGERPGFVDERGQVVVVEGDGVRRLPGLPARTIVEPTVVYLDRSGILWTNPTGVGLQAQNLATGATTAYRHDPARPESLPDTRVTGLFEDREGALWMFGRLGVRVMPPGWSVFRSLRLPPTDFAYVVAPGRQGRVWAGRACGPFGTVEPDASLTPMEQRLPSVARALQATGLCAVSVVEARDGTTWLPGWGFGGRNGLLQVLTDGTWQLHKSDGSPGSIPSDDMRVVHEDPAGRIWVATENGLARFAPDGQFESFQADAGDDSGLQASTIWALADAPDGQLWVGTYTGGLSLFDPASGRVVRTFRFDAADPSTISSDIVTAIHASRSDSGSVWVGTYDGGLNRLDLATGRFERWTRADGLPDLTVKSILEDDRGDLWIGTNGGLARLDPATGTLAVYTESDGLPGIAFGLYDAAVLPDGQFAYAVEDALVTFDPTAVGRTAFSAPVVLRGLRVDGTERAVPGAGGAIRLAPGERALGVEVAALSFSAPERIRYEVRLAGLDADWVDIGPDRSTSWAGLPPGTYTLQVRAGTASGVWSANELAVPVEVLPRWWQRGSVRALLVLALLAGFALAVRDLSQRRLRQRLAVAERDAEAARRVRDERQRISRDLHDHVGAQLSSLLAGVELAKLARRAGGDGGVPTTDPLVTLEADARETIRQLRETIWTLHDESLTARALCERIETFVRERARGRIDQTEVTCALPPDRVVGPEAALALFRIAQEAITNALKHARAQSLRVVLDGDAAVVTLSVSDDGTFRPPAAPGALTGFGVDSMRTRAESLGGTFALGTDAGTTVSVVIPDASALPAEGEAGDSAAARP